MQEDQIVKPINLSQAKEVVFERLPDLKVKSIKYLGGGSSSAFSINNELIVKFPKLDFDGQQYADFLQAFRREVKLNKIVSKIVKPHEIITPLEQVLGPTQNFAGPIFLYQLFSGTEVEKYRFTSSEKEKLVILLGDFLKKLHSVNLNQTLFIGLSKVTLEDIKIGWHKQYVYYKRNVFPLLKSNEVQWFTALYEDFLADSAKMKLKVVLTHGDFGPENVLVPKEFNRLQIIDFEDMALADPVLDFCVWYQHFGTSFVNQMLESYGKVDKYFLMRVKFYSSRLPLIYFDLYRKSGNKKFLTFARKFLKKIKTFLNYRFSTISRLFAIQNY